jgi:hypothetical protein
MEYYTYAYLREDGTPYYIGKGKGDRAYRKHFRSKVRGGFFSPPPRDRILILKENLTNEEANQHEIYMIAVLGRKDNNTGILRNLTDGGEGGLGHIPWNKGGTIPDHQKQSNRQMLLDRYANGLDVSGANNPRAKTWRIVYEDGREITIKSIHDWAKREGYSKSGIRNLRIGKWKKHHDLVTVEEVV